MNTFEYYWLSSAGRDLVNKWGFTAPDDDVSCALCGSQRRKQLYCLGKTQTVECECGFRYVTPQLSEQALDSYYQHFYEMDHRDFEGRRHEMFEDLDERRRKIQDRHVEIELTNQFTKTGRILDIGCGPGLYFEGLSGQQKLFAVEASPSAARYVTERFSATVQTARVEDAEFDDESFDVINLTYVIEHLKDPVGIMQKATRWLRPGGLLLTSSPNWDSPMARLFQEFFRLNEPNQHIALWTPTTVTRLLSLCDVKLQSIRYPYFETEYFNRYEVMRLFRNSTVCLVLPILVRCGFYPKLSTVLSPPFWGSIMVTESLKKG